MAARDPVLEVLDPTAGKHGGEPAKTAARLNTLEGTSVGLLWNGKAMGDVALKRASELIGERVRDVRFQFYSGSMPCPPSLLKEVAEECDAVIACTSDCGSCTSWMAHDCVQLERTGTPTVIIASKGFEHDLESSAQAFAMPNPYYVVVPKVYNNLDEAEARAQTEVVVDDVIGQLTVDGSRPGALATGQPDKTWTYSAATTMEALASFNHDFLARDWGDGYPLWPPTVSTVAALVDGIDGEADDVVCHLPPGNGVATVEKVATNAAMAGCRPDELPVVLAVLRAIAKMRPVPRVPLMSTSAHAPLVMVNGPIGRAIGVNGGRACLGPGRQNEVNIRISRAVVLCLKNIGSWYPGVMDLDTIGTTRKHIVVVAENEEESPWEPYHVTQGFAESDSTVTVFFTSGEWDISIQGHLDAHQLAKSIASFSCGNSGTGYFANLAGENDGAYRGRLLFVPPPHAVPLAKEAGFTKRGLEKFMFHHSQEPVSRMIEPIRKLHQDGKIKPEWQWLFELSEAQASRLTLPAIESSDSYAIAVVGSVRAKDLLMPTRAAPYTEAITRTPC